MKGEHLSSVLLLKFYETVTTAGLCDRKSHINSINIMAFLFQIYFFPSHITFVWFIPGKQQK